MLLFLLLFSCVGSVLSYHGECVIRTNGIKWGSVYASDNKLTFDIKTHIRKNFFRVLESHASECSECFSTDGIELSPGNLVILKDNDEFIEYKIIRGTNVGPWNEEPNCKYFCFRSLYEKMMSYCT